MASGDKSFGLILGIDEEATKKKIQEQLSKIINQINSHKSSANSVTVYVDKTATRKAFASDLSRILNRLNTVNNLKFLLQLDTARTETNFKTQIQQIINNLNTNSLSGFSLNLNVQTPKKKTSLPTNTPKLSSNSASKTGKDFTEEESLNRYWQYVNKITRLENEIKAKQLGNRVVSNPLVKSSLANNNSNLQKDSISINDYLSALRNQALATSSSSLSKEMYAQWEMWLATLETGIRKVESDLSSLDKQTYLSKVQQEWSKFGKEVEKSKFATDTFKKSVKDALKELNSVNSSTTAQDFDDIVDKLNKLKSTFTTNKNNYDPINLKDKESQLKKYRSLLSEIEHIQALSTQKSSLTAGIKDLENATTATDYQEKLKLLQKTEKEIQNQRTKFKAANIGEQWKRQSNEVSILEEKLRRLELTESEFYNSLITLKEALQNIQLVDTKGTILGYDSVAFKNWSEQFKTLKSVINRYTKTLPIKDTTVDKKYSQISSARGLYSELQNVSSMLDNNDSRLNGFKTKVMEILQALGRVQTNTANPIQTNQTLNELATSLSNVRSQYTSWKKEQKFTLDETKLQTQRESFELLQRQIIDSQFASDKLRQSLGNLSTQLSQIKTPFELAEFGKQFEIVSKQAKAEQLIANVDAFNNEVKQNEIVTDKFKTNVSNLLAEITRLNQEGSFDEIIKKSKQYQKFQQQFQNVSSTIAMSQATASTKRYGSLINQYQGLHWYDNTVSVKLGDALNKSRQLTNQFFMDERGGATNNPDYLSKKVYDELIKALDEADARIKVLQRDYSAFIQRSSELAKFSQQIKKSNIDTSELEKTVRTLSGDLYKISEKPINERRGAFQDFDKQFQALQTRFRDMKSQSDKALSEYYSRTNANAYSTYQLQKEAIENRITALGETINKMGDKASPQTQEMFTNLKNQTPALTNAYDQLYKKFQDLKEILNASKKDFGALTEVQKNELRALQGLETQFNKTTGSFNNSLSTISKLLNVPEATKKSYNDLKELQQTITKFGNANNRLFQNNYFKGQFTSLSGEISQVLSNAAATNNITEKQVEDFTARWRTLRNEILNTGTTGQTFGTKLANQFSKLGVYFSAATVFMRIRTYMRNMYENVKEVDNAMTSLKRVTKETHDTYKDFFRDSIERAKKLGATLSDTINATADFKRLGYSLKEATELADTAIVYQQVGDEVEDIGTATSSIVSTMKAFDIQAEDSISIVDRFNEVANNFSITAGGIGQALQNSASSLSAANNTLDESLALIVAGNNVVQNPNEVGTALKTLTMRLRNAKADLSELGEDTDGMADSVSKLRGQIKALSGVDIMETEDSFKSTYQILKELSKVWNKLTDVNQASLTELIAGKRQGNLMSSIMSNFDDAENVVRVASRSIGSAETEHEKKLQSINGKLNILQSTFQELSDTVMEDDVVKGAIKGLTALLDIINRLVKSGGSLKTVATILGTALLSFNNKGLITKNALGDRRFFWNNYISQIQDEKNAINTSLVKIFGGSAVTGKDANGNDITTQYTSTLNEHLEKNKVSQENIKGVTQNFIKTTLAGYNQDMIKGIENTNNLADAQAKLNDNTRLYHTLVGKVKAGVRTLANVGLSFVNMLGNAVMSMAVSALIGVVVSAIRSTRQAIDEANQATQDFISRSKDLANTQDSIVALKEKLTDKNITEEESLSVRKELYEIQKDMIGRYGTEAKGIDLVKDSVDSLNDSFETLRKNELEKEYRQNAKGYEESINRLYGKDSIELFAWNRAKTGFLNLESQWGNTITKEEIDALRKAVESSGLKPELIDSTTLKDLTTLTESVDLDLGTQLKEEGKTAFDLAQSIDSISENLSGTINEWRQVGKDSSQLEYFLQQLSEYYESVTGSDYSVDVANGKFMGEYLVKTTKEYDMAYRQLVQAQEKYQQEQTSNPENISKDVISQYQNARQKIQDLIQNNLINNYGEDRIVKDFLQNLVDTANTDLAKEDFKLKIQTDEENLQTNLKKLLKRFANGHKIFASDIINFNPDADVNKNNLSIINAFNLIKGQADKVNVSLETFVGWLVELGLVESDVTEKKTYNFVKMLDMTSESMEAVTKKIDEVQSAFKTVKEVIEDYEDKKILTIDSAQKLIDLGDNYIQYLFDENGHLKINEESYSKLTKAKIELLRAELLQNAIDNIKQIKTEADAVEYLKDKVKEETEATNEYSSALLKKLYLEGMSNKNKTVQKAVQYIYDTYVNYSRILDNVNTSYQENEMESTSVTKELNNQKDALEKQKKALEKSKQALDDNKDSLDDNKQVLEDINTELEKDKDYIEDLVSLTVDMLKQKYEDEKETIEKSKQAYKEKVDALKEALDEEKEAYDRYKSYTDKNKNISLLEQQASALKGTKSVEGIQRLNEINKDLSEKQQELYDEQYSNSIDDRKNALDKEYEHKEKLWDKEINRIDELLKNERQLRVQAMNLIDSKTQQFYNNLWEYTYKYTTKSRFEFENLWNNAYKALEKYGWGQLACIQVMDLLEQKIYNNQVAIDGLDRQIKILNESLDGTANSIDGISKEIEKLDDKINELSKSYEKATKTKDAFEPEISKVNPVYTYTVKFGLDTYSVTDTSETSAIARIQAMLIKDGRPVSDDYAKRNIKRYAKGTSYSKGGLSLVDEDGLNSEWVLKKGRLDYLPEGSIVFNRAETKALKMLAQSSDKVKQIINNPDYLSYFRSHIEGGNGSNLNFAKTHGFYQNVHTTSKQNINMPITVNVSNSGKLNETKFAEKVANLVFRDMNKYSAWYG